MNLVYKYIHFWVQAGPTNHGDCRGLSDPLISYHNRCMGGRNSLTSMKAKVMKNAQLDLESDVMCLLEKKYGFVCVIREGTSGPGSTITNMKSIPVLTSSVCMYILATFAVLETIGYFVEQVHAATQQTKGWFDHIIHLDTWHDLQLSNYFR